MASQAVVGAEKRTGQVFKRRSFYDHDFSNQNLSYADFRSATLIGCNFDNCDLSYANFDSANLDGSSFRQTRIYRTSFKDACLARVRMEPRDMFGATFTLHCNSTDGMKASPLWAACWLQLLLAADLPEENRQKIREAGESLVGKERMATIARAMGAREI